MRKRVNKHSQLLNQFWSRWKGEYLTSLREFNSKISGHNKQAIGVGNIVVVHDDKPRLQWRLAIVEELIRGRDNLVRAAHIRMGTYKTMHPIVKLYPLEVSSEDQCDSDTQVTSDNKTHEEATSDNTDTTSSSVRTRRKAYSKALRKMSEWTNTLSRGPGGCRR